MVKIKNSLRDTTANLPKSWDSKMYLWGPRDSESGMIVLARSSSNLPEQRTDSSGAQLINTTWLSSERSYAPVNAREQLYAPVFWQEVGRDAECF